MTWSAPLSHSSSVLRCAHPRIAPTWTSSVITSDSVLRPVATRVPQSARPDYARRASTSVVSDPSTACPATSVPSSGGTPSPGSVSYLGSVSTSGFGRAFATSTASSIRSNLPSPCRLRRFTASSPTSTFGHLMMPATGVRHCSDSLVYSGSASTRRYQRAGPISGSSMFPLTCRCHPHYPFLEEPSLTPTVVRVCSRPDLLCPSMRPPITFPSSLAIAAQMNPSSSRPRTELQRPTRSLPIIRGSKLKHKAVRIGLDPTNISDHSLRRGGTTACSSLV